VGRVSRRAGSLGAPPYYRGVWQARDWRSRGYSALGVLAALAAATALVAFLESVVGLDNASSVYLLAVVGVAIRLGTVPAIGTAVGAFLVYNLLFVDPRLTFGVTSADEVLTLVLLLFVGIVIGQLAGRQRDRERAATRREEEARSLFRMSRDLATSERLSDAMQSLVGQLAAEAGMERTWIGLGATIAHERAVADSANGAGPTPQIGTHAVLQRDRDEGSATWTRIRPPVSPPHVARTEAVVGGRYALYRVEIRAGPELIGSLWSQRAESAGRPGLEQSRLLAAAADQIGQALRRERLAAQAAEAEIARRSEELKGALVDSVSHDLRTPLATIRAAAGSLADTTLDLDAEERRAAARAIDDEAARLNRMVGNLLDMSRIQGGALVADIEMIPLDEVLVPAVDRARGGSADRVIELDLPSETPVVRVDAALLDRVVSNLLENAVNHAGRGAPIRVRGETRENGTVAIVVEDGGPGVPMAALPGLFDRFRPGMPQVVGGRRGFGLGLAIVDGFARAMGGSVSAGPSPLGGLAVTVVVPTARTGDIES
jgi:two-component system, OmpR family, sensor histidine kinase KdpD